MSEVQRRCQLNGCNRAAFAQCFCCNNNICTRHFTEHVDAVKVQIDPLANEINIMTEQIQNLAIEQITEASFTKLEQWQVAMHTLIDEIYLVKRKEIEDLIKINNDRFVEHKNQQIETTIKMQDDIKQLVEDSDATFEQIQLLKNQLTNVETSLTSFRNNFIIIEFKVLNQDFVTISSNLNKPSIFQGFSPNFGMSSNYPISQTSTSSYDNSIFGASLSTPFNFGTGFSFSKSDNSSHNHKKK